MNYELHPLCTFFPRITGAEFDNLVADIMANGLREPIILHDGMILDGGNRYRACLQAGVEPSFMKFGGADLVSYVLSANLHRRHLSPGQQAAIVASMQDWANQAASGSNQHTAKTKEGGQDYPPSELDTRAKRASISGASEKTQKMADKVAKSDPALAVQVAHGEISLPDAVEIVTGKRPGSKKPKPEPTPEELYDPRDDTISGLNDTIIELANENDALKNQVVSLQAAGGDDSAFSARVDELQAKIAELESQLAVKIRSLDAVSAMRDEYMRENGELKKEVAMLRRRLKNAESA